MRDKELYGRILGVEAPWRVADVELNLQQGEIVVHVEHGGPLTCPLRPSRAPLRQPSTAVAPSGHLPVPHGSGCRRTAVSVPAARGQADRGAVERRPLAADRAVRGGRDRLAADRARLGLQGTCDDAVEVPLSRVGAQGVAGVVPVGDPVSSGAGQAGSADGQASSGRDRDGGGARGEQRAGGVDQRGGAEVEVRSARLRNRQRFRNAIYFHLGGLDLYPAGVGRDHLVHTKA